MSRRRTRQASSAGQGGTPATPGPARSESTPVSTDLSFRLAVDDVLAQMADERLGEGRDNGRDKGPGAPAAASAPGLISTTVPVAGMTCRTCEVRIQRFVGRLPNVEGVRASAVRGRVEIESSAPVPGPALSAHACPPIAPASARTIARPIPDPPDARLRAASIR